MSKNETNIIFSYFESTNQQNTCFFSLHLLRLQKKIQLFCRALFWGPPLYLMISIEQIILYKFIFGTKSNTHNNCSSYSFKNYHDGPIEDMTRYIKYRMNETIQRQPYVHMSIQPIGCVWTCVRLRMCMDMCHCSLRPRVSRKI